MANKAEIRAERDFIKKANDCSNCKNLSDFGALSASTCKVDGYTVQKQSWCKSHDFKGVK